MSQNDKLEVIRYHVEIQAGEERTFKERIKGACTISRITGKFYEGQKLGLQVRPMLIKKGNVPTNLVTFPKDTRDYLSGNEEPIDYHISYEGENDDEIHVKVTNTNTFPCNLNIAISVDYYGGKRRVI